MEDKALEDRANAARELLANLGVKTPALWEMRAIVAALRDAEDRGAAREREECATLAETFDDFCDTPCRTADLIADRIRSRPGRVGQKEGEG